MDVRKKLVELLLQEDNVCKPSECKDCGANGSCYYYRTADKLIANGVTVQEWISVEDKLPPYNHNVLVYRPNMAMEILVDNYSEYYGEDDDEWHEGWALYGEDAYGNPVITHWAYFPQPPKGE